MASALSRGLGHYGHLHVRNNFDRTPSTSHEVSLGYPGQWKGAIDVPYLRIIL